MMTADHIRALLRAACEKAGSLRAWGAARGVQSSYVSDVLAGKREPGPQICEALEVERVVMYRKRRAT